MKTEEEILQVVAAIEVTNTDGGDLELEAMRDALLFVLGDREANAEDFIRMYIAE